MRLLSSFLLVMGCTAALAQTSKLYLNLVSHNEMKNEVYDTDSVNFTESTAFVQQIAMAVINKQAKWDFQSCSKYILGVHNFQDAYNNPGNILQWMSESGFIEVDPRPKTETPDYNYNISDVVHLLDSAGVPDSKVVGGFVYYPFNQEDWTPYENIIWGNVYGNPWQADIAWGAGSFPPHTHDANDFGIWKPSAGTDSVSFYTHDANNHLWVEGNGCAPVLDSLTGPDDIFAEIKTIAEEISSGSWPSDKFYCYTIMINQRDFSAALVQKVSTLIDSINTLVSAGEVEWATVNEKFSAFQQWSSQNNIPYSQWYCGETVSSPDGIILSALLSVFPNPADFSLTLKPGTMKYPLATEIFNSEGKLVKTGNLSSAGDPILLQAIPDGIYFLRVRDGKGKVYSCRFVRY